MQRSDFEIMAPAGSRETLAAALQAGADSVYFGIGALNMRAHSAGGFTIDDLNEIAVMALYYGDKPLGVLGISFCGEKQMNEVAVGRAIRKCGVQVATLLSNE